MTSPVHVGGTSPVHVGGTSPAHVGGTSPVHVGVCDGVHAVPGRREAHGRSGERLGEQLGEVPRGETRRRVHPVDAGRATQRVLRKHVRSCVCVCVCVCVRE